MSRLVLNRRGVSQLLKSPGFEADMLRRAKAIAVAASAGGDAGEFEASSKIGSRRARASVITADDHARAGEAKDRRLTRAIDAGRR